WSRTRELIGVNVLSPVRLAHHYLPGMIKRGGGKILNVASVAGMRATPYFSSYCGAKAFMIQFSKSLALEVNDENVHVCCLLPGTTATEFWQISGMQEKVSQRIGGFDDPRETAVFGINQMEKGMISGVPGLKNKVKELMKNILPEQMWFYLIKRHMTHPSLFAKRK
ncbi:MAG: SDR family NAD(P)-dependent oxidoreductase, partial [Smithella sp.]